jgi:hypothetical protein
VPAVFLEEAFDRFGGAQRALDILGQTGPKCRDAGGAYDMGAVAAPVCWSWPGQWQPGEPVDGLADLVAREVSHAAHGEPDGAPRLPGVVAPVREPNLQLLFGGSVAGFAGWVRMFSGCRLLVGQHAHAQRDVDDALCGVAEQRVGRGVCWRVRIAVDVGEDLPSEPAHCVGLCPSHAGGDAVGDQREGARTCMGRPPWTHRHAETWSAARKARRGIPTVVERAPWWLGHAGTGWTSSGSRRAWCPPGGPPPLAARSARAGRVVERQPVAAVLRVGGRGGRAGAGGVWAVAQPTAPAGATVRSPTGWRRCAGPTRRRGGSAAWQRAGCAAGRR